MNQLKAIDGSRVKVPINWEMLTGENVSESEFIASIAQLPLDHVLPRLVGLLRYCDINEPLAYQELDSASISFSPA